MQFSECLWKHLECRTFGFIPSRGKRFPSFPKHHKQPPVRCDLGLFLAAVKLTTCILCTGTAVLEKGGEDQLDWSCEKWGKWTSYIQWDERRLTRLRRNFLLKHVTEGKIEGTRRRGRIHEQLLADSKDRKRCHNLEEWALDRTVWRTRYGRVYRPIVRRTWWW